MPPIYTYRLRNASPMLVKFLRAALGMAQKWERSRKSIHICGVGNETGANPPQMQVKRGRFEYKRTLVRRIEGQFYLMCNRRCN